MERAEYDQQWQEAGSRLQLLYNKKIQLAAAAAAELPGDYWRQTLERRLYGHPQQSGGYWVVRDVVELSQWLLGANWWPHPHPHILPGCQGFKADVPGFSGIIDLRTVPGDKLVQLVDPKSTGEAFAEISGYEHPPVDFSVVIVGEEQGKEVVFTIHPGNPAPHRGLPMELVLEQTGGKQELPAAQALELGLEFASLRARGS